MQDFYIVIYEFLFSYPPEKYEIWWEIINNTGFFMLITSAATMIFFYYVLNGISAKYYKTKHWLVIMGLNALLNIIIALIIVPVISEGEYNFYDLITLRFALVNMIWAIVFYLLFTIAFKWFSPHAKYTPF